VTLDQFRVKYPEFRTASSEFVQAYLDAAAEFVSADVLGTAYDQAHGLKAAHMMAKSPGGVMARLVAKDGSTTYDTQFRELLRSRIAGVSVV